MFRKFDKTMIFLKVFKFYTIDKICTGISREMYVDNETGWYLPDRSTFSVEPFFTDLLLPVFLTED